MTPIHINVYMKKFFLQSTALTASVVATGAILYTTFLAEYYKPVLLFAVLFFFVATNIIHSFLLKIAVKSGSRFSSHYMAISFLKMFFYLLVAVIYALINREFAKIFLANFLMLYVIYTTFEVIQFSRFVRGKKSSHSE